MNKIVLIILTLFLYSCTFEPESCSNREDCERLIINKIESNWIVPEDKKNYGKVGLIISLKKDGSTRSIQVYNRANVIEPTESLMAAVMRSVPFTEIKIQLENEYEDYKRLNLAFYDKQLTKIISRDGLDGNVLRSKIHLLDTLEYKDIKSLMGEPDEKTNCKGLTLEYQCWVYRSVGTSPIGEARFLFRDKYLNFVSLNYNDVKQAFGEGQDYEKLIRHTGSVDDIIREIGEPTFFGYVSRKEQLSLNYRKGIIKNNYWYPGLRIYYKDGKRQGSTIIQNNSGKVN